MVFQKKPVDYSVQNSTEVRTFRDGIIPEIADIAGVPARTTTVARLDVPPPDTKPVAYVEEKQIDWQRVSQFLSLSERANRWTNFGPVSVVLERALEHVLRLPSGRAVVVASSGTAALFALAGLHAARSGRPLRWLVSAFGFFSTAVGPLADSVRILDCGRDGFLDLEAAGRLPEGSWDGMLVTNVFGLDRTLARYREFCRDRGKVLLIDNAAALFGCDRTEAGTPDEIISFHHTKPWGVGEGGCAIVPRSDAHLLRRLLDFGVGAPASLKPFAANGKISDIACATILERLERLPSWSHSYRSQYRRLTKLAVEAGLKLLAPPPGDALSPCVPALAPAPVSADALGGGPFIMRKYYRPLSPDAPKAADLYARIINIPAHPGMASLTCDSIVGRLKSLADPRTAST